ncbi:MAG: hypothetical protein GWM98_17170 [Nitrospinaceae bacterium]|nr:hypothetical protein [Nitrospinaceae bacterium]NIR55903.1 hypothetical protein [Nitrospinaceae bacterium]NIS86349.1 hypothetical protein [Nitrospinaceae bacterium]NIT83185.1 hypothetical protein [Nitrospinaceae bacterium]NIU43940.1 hypothetical protein [Nitrospinaceae bacterium]
MLLTPDTVFVGLSERTSAAAVEALAALSPRPVVGVPVHRGLHLKTSVTFLGNHLLLIDPESVETSRLREFEWIVTGADERYAANALALGKKVILPAGFSRVAGEIQNRGFEVLEVPLSEFEKADGGVTCLSLIIPEVPV